MIDSGFIIVSGFVTSIMCVAAWWKWRGGAAPIPSEMFIVMSGGAASIALFYIGVKLGVSNLPRMSRWLWIMILASTAFMAVSVLVINGKNDKDGR